MERRQIRELIGRFLHNDVPGELQTQFRRWMLQPGDGDEKEAALREEWTAVVESPAAADRSEELQRLRHTIRMREAQQRRSRIFRRIRYAAAAAAVLLFAVGEYYYVRSASAVPAEIRLLTARGSKGEFQLPDGTKVWLNASSRLTYPETFDRRERRVTLEDIITNLERWFNVPIGTDASVDRTIRLSFHVRHESLEETLQVISLITGLQYTLDSESATFHTARTTR
ncbi:MAG: FecR domain-containing protein [Alistipes finegoldii]|uniref:FecR family protein n=1 Tax=Alistipes finegoldii TaxID=214856 RepID=UPI0039A0D8AF